MQRHNELLEVIKSDPSRINEVVSRRRKDFTDEFFLHVHTVAESYHDNPPEQNREFEYFLRFLSDDQTIYHAWISFSHDLIHRSNRNWWWTRGPIVM